VRDPYIRYNRLEYIAVVGSGNTRQDAERYALGNLVAQFGQSIQVDEKVSTVYREIVKGNVVKWSEVTSSETIVELTAGIDTLVGAEIGEAWVDPKGTHYVAAVLNRSRAVRIYTEIVMTNLSMIERLTTAEEKYSLGGCARFLLAAAIADVTVIYANLLRQIGSPIQGVRNGDVYRLEAADILRAIPVSVVVTKERNVDRAGRIESAFARSLSTQGFRSSGYNSRYLLDVNISLTPVTFLDGQFYWTRIEVIANLRDAATGTVLMSFGFTCREGHASQAEADNRAIMAAERRIDEDFAVLFGDT
jgi:hypothetical protein